MINQKVITTRLAEISENLAILEEMKAVPLEKFIKQPKTYKLAERCFQLGIECVIDIAHYLLSQKGWEHPAGSTEAILQMARHRVFPLAFARSIAGMVNFRDILLHAYLKIDRRIVYEYLQRLEDLRTFQKHIMKFLQKKAAKVKR